MSVKTIDYLKQRFATGQQPTAQDFIDLFDSFRHRSTLVPGNEVDGFPFSSVNAIPTTDPNDYAVSAIFFTSTVGVYPNFLDSDGDPLEVLANEFATFVRSGTSWEKHLINFPFAALNAVFDLDFTLDPAIEILTRKADKSATTFNLSVNNTLIAWDEEAYYNPQDLQQLVNVKLKANAAGDVKIYFLTVAGSTATVRHIETVTVAGSGVQTIDASTFTIPNLTAYNQVYIAIGNVLTGGPFRYRNGQTGMNSRTASPVAIGSTTAVTNSTANEFAYWITIKSKSALEKAIIKVSSNEAAIAALSASLTSISNTLQGNITAGDAAVQANLNAAVAATDVKIGGVFDLDFSKDPAPNTVIAPSDKSATNFSSGGVSNTAFWWDNAAYFNPQTSKFSKFHIKANAAGNVKVVFITVSGTTATIRHIETIAVPGSGVQNIDFSAITLPDLTAYTQVWVGFTNESAGGPARSLNSGTSQDAKYCNVVAVGATAAITSANNLNFGYWISTIQKSQLEIMSNKVNASTVTTYAELVAALTSNAEIKFSGNPIITLTSTLNITAPKKLVGPVTFSLAPGVTTGINIASDGVHLEHIKIEAPAYAKPTLAATDDIDTEVGKGTITGISMIGTSGTRRNNITLRDIEVLNCDAYGIYAEYCGNYIGTFTRGLFFENVRCTNCYIGFKASTRVEYSRFVGISCASCVCGIVVRSGNLTFSSCLALNSQIGIFVGTGENDGHGTFGSCLINHNTVNIYAKSLINGIIFDGCHTWAGTVVITDCVGFLWSGGMMASPITHSGKNNAANAIMGAQFVFDSVYPTPITETVPAYPLRLKNNYYNTNNAAQSALNN